MAQAQTDNAIVQENRKEGTDRWFLQGASDRIAGYPSRDSAAHGQTIRFHVHCDEPGPATAVVYRMGWYGGLGGRRMADLGKFPGYHQDLPPRAFRGVAWPESFHLTIPSDWPTGVYLVRISRLPQAHDAMDEAYIPFIVREERRKVDLLHVLPTFTWQGYNRWGGASFYWIDGSFNGGGWNGAAVGLDRPYALYQNYGASLPAWTVGSGEFFMSDYAMARFIEETGYDAAYATSRDLHDDPSILERTRAFVSSGHDEYWTQAMRDQVRDARDRGMHVAFFSANEICWRVGLTENPETGVAGRGIRREISFAGQGEPENQISGLRFQDCFVLPAQPMTVKNTGHFLYEGTGFKEGDAVAGVIGFEYDTADREAEKSPPGLEILAESRVAFGGSGPGAHHMAYYRHPSGAMGFGGGSIYLPWALGRRGRQDERFRRFARNLFGRMLEGEWNNRYQAPSKKMTKDS